MLLSKSYLHFLHVVSNTSFNFKMFFIIIIERDSEQRNMSVWERSGCSNTSISSMLQNSVYQVASSRKYITLIFEI